MTLRDPEGQGCDPNMSHKWLELDSITMEHLKEMACAESIANDWSRDLLRAGGIPCIWQS